MRAKKLGKSMTINNQHHIRVRFAPSPTGHLHVGSLRVALFNYLFARHNNGDFLVRIEDTDRERSKKEYIESILESLRWVGLEPDIKLDKSVVMQSEQHTRHIEVINQLLAENKAYKCYCTQEDILARTQIMSGNNAEDIGYIQYDKKCRHSTQEYADKPYVVRFEISNDIENIAFKDLIRGEIIFKREQLDDFIIMRSDGLPTYNFVVVVDDADMGITQVIRGEDHISNTPKQILLYKACGFKVPEFAHLPLILGPTGQRLSKRDAATAVLDYKDKGFLPDALCNYLVRLGWAHGDQEIFTRQELIAYFSLDAVGKKASIFDIQKLEWVNSIYLKNSTSRDLYYYIEHELNINLEKKFSTWKKDCIIYGIDLYKSRVKTLVELIQELTALYTYNMPEKIKINDEDEKAWITPETESRLCVVEHALYQQEQFTLDQLKNIVKNITSNLNIKLQEVAKPLRLALTGQTSTPGVFDLLVLLGKKESMRRIHKFREYIQKSI